ncbi:MAG: hypothetical protein Q9164_007396, partial [Protoblastenia rupestris]
MPWHSRHRPQHSKDLSSTGVSNNPLGAKEENVPLKGNHASIAGQKVGDVQSNISITRQDGPIITKQSYWAIAASRLKDEDEGVYEALQALLQEVPKRSDSLPSELSRVIEKHKRIMEDRQWELPFKVRGRNVKIRSQLERVSKSLHVFKDLGSAAAQLDPTHAGIPWAGAMFIVQGALNDSEQNEAALDGLAQVAPIVAQYAEIESIYINTSSTTLTKSFEDCLVDLYLQKIKDKDMVCKQITQIFDTQDQRVAQYKLQDIIYKQNERIDQVTNALDDISADLKRQETGRILCWLCKVVPGLDHQDVMVNGKMGSDYAHSG